MHGASLFIAPLSKLVLDDLEQITPRKIAVILLVILDVFLSSSPSLKNNELAGMRGIVKRRSGKPLQLGAVG